MTAWIERTQIGAKRRPTTAARRRRRFLVAGRALWFYLGKLAWPARLTFVYPRWAVDSRAPFQYLFPLAAAAALAALWAIRGRTRGPLAAALLFAGILFPALGFINVFPFIYSFVADHFQYLAAAAMLPAFAALFVLATAAKLGRPRPDVSAHGARLAAGCVVALLAGLTRRQCAMYTDADTLWRATIARNPACWMAYNNLAADLLEAGRTEEAIENARQSLRYSPENAEAFVTLGDALLQKGRYDEALAQGRPCARDRAGKRQSPTTTSGTRCCGRGAWRRRPRTTALRSRPGRISRKPGLTLATPACAGAGPPRP